MSYPVEIVLLDIAYFAKLVTLLLIIRTNLKVNPWGLHIRINFD